jgi:hypothetical protein
VPIHQQTVLARWLFLRALGLIYLVAFASFGSQITGLIGANGILPLADYLSWLAKHDGVRAYVLAPTIFWLNTTDGVLQLACAAGIVGALLLLAGIDDWKLLLVLFVLYLSLVTAGQDFMAYQWDSLLLETGFLAIGVSSSSRLVVWLYRWLVFKLMFLSGVTKLLSGDPTWRELSALNYHFETQPLPTVFGWYAQQLPEWFHRLATALVLAVEVGAPWLIFTTRRLRMLAAAAFIGLQLLIALTGNYAFFNLLAIALCLWLLDDQALSRWLPGGLSARIREAAMQDNERDSDRWRSAGVAAVVLGVSALQIVAIAVGQAWPPAGELLAWVEPWRIANNYGLFTNMTTERPEIVVEGSNDGQTWQEYGFRFKPGDVAQAPAWAAPHQPRLDWQLWFAALGYQTDKPWLTERLFGSNAAASFWLANQNVDPGFVSFLLRLLRGAPAVQALLAYDPFPGAPPRYVRALLYRYRFTAIAEHNAQGSWWQRERLGTYFPAIALGSGP